MGCSCVKGCLLSGGILSFFKEKKTQVNEIKTEIKLITLWSSEGYTKDRPWHDGKQSTKAYGIMLNRKEKLDVGRVGLTLYPVDWDGSYSMEK